jgi:hypothetical protein
MTVNRRHVVALLLLAVAAYLASLGTGATSAITKAATADLATGATAADLELLATLYADAGQALTAETPAPPPHTAALHTWLADRLRAHPETVRRTPALTLAVPNAIADMLEPWGEIPGQTAALDLTPERRATLATLLEQIAHAIRAAV